MRFSHYFLSLSALSFIFVSFALASTNDTQQPITIEANHAELDEQKGISIYTGNVILQQGGIKITADKLTVHLNNGNLQHITIEGDPVHFSQQRDDLENITGTSLRMEYDAERKRFLLIDSAELLQGKNRFSGQRIQFDPEKEKVIATGSTGESGKSTQRVQITIQPKAQEKPTGTK